MKMIMWCQLISLKVKGVLVSTAGFRNATLKTYQTRENKGSSKETIRFTLSNKFLHETPLYQ